MTRQITIEEVKKHKHKSSVWMIIHNDVYDVTSFLEEHPGGEESLTAFAGKDGTQVFEDVNHSEDARELMKKYKIGTLPPEQHNKNIDSCCNTKLRRRTSFGSQKSRCSICSAPSCSHLPKMLKSDKSWRTFDGGSSFSRTESIKADSKKNIFEPKSERRVGTIVVPPQSKIPPRYNRARRFPCDEGPTEVPCEGGYNYKWALLALTGVLVLGFVLKKYLAR